MHKKEAKYVVNLTNKNIALDGRFVEKFSILYLGTREPKQWNTVYSALIRKGKIMLARTHQEAIEILEKNLPGNLVSSALKRNAKKKDVDNEVREVEYDGNIRRYTTEKGILPAGRLTPERSVEDTAVEEEAAFVEEPVSENEAVVNESVEAEHIEEAVQETEVIKEEETVSKPVTETEDTKAPDSEAFGLAGDEEDTGEITLSELKAKAKAAGVKGYTKMSREDLIEALKG